MVQNISWQHPKRDKSFVSPKRGKSFVYSTQELSETKWIFSKILEHPQTPLLPNHPLLMGE
jgi:hypothetical protein